MARFLSGVGAESPRGRSVYTQRLMDVSTPPSEPGVRLSPHRARHSSVSLSLLSVTREAKRRKIFRYVCLRWSFESSNWSDMIYLGCFWRDLSFTQLP